jgi:hypothetical protein
MKACLVESSFSVFRILSLYLSAIEAFGCALAAVRICFVVKKGWCVKNSRSTLPNLLAHTKVGNLGCYAAICVDVRCNEPTCRQFGGYLSRPIGFAKRQSSY